MRRLLRSQSNSARRASLIYQPTLYFILIFLGCVCVFAVLSFWSLHSQVTTETNTSRKIPDPLNRKISYIKEDEISKVQFPQLQNQIRGIVDRFGKGRRIIFEVENLDADLSGDEVRGRFVVQLHPEWAPLGVERFVVCCWLVS